MPGSKSDYLENKLLDHVLTNTAYTSPTTVYVGLYTVAPTDAGGGTEVTGNNYARESVSFASAVAGETSNDAEVEFGTPSATWGEVVAFGVFDADTAGNLLYWGDLTNAKTINTGDTVKFLVNELDVSED
jgi:hypothetical protein